MDVVFLLIQHDNVLSKLFIFTHYRLNMNLFGLYCTSLFCSFFSVFTELENSDSDGGGGDGDDDDDDATAGDRSYVEDTSFLKVRSE